jgi:hypothetical protein
MNLARELRANFDLCREVNPGSLPEPRILFRLRSDHQPLSSFLPQRYIDGYFSKSVIDSTQDFDNFRIPISAQRHFPGFQPQYQGNKHTKVWFTEHHASKKPDMAEAANFYPPLTSLFRRLADIFFRGVKQHT